MSAMAPTGLMCELLEHPEKSRISVKKPMFGWIMNDVSPDATQLAYQILVSSTLDFIEIDVGDEWDSGKVITASPGEVGNSVAVEYGGNPLRPNEVYYWKVRTWNQNDQMSPWSEVQTFKTGDPLVEHATAVYMPVETEVPPIRTAERDDGVLFFDFGRAAFGTVVIELDSPDERVIVAHLGEVLDGDDVINRSPGGSRRYRRIELQVKPGRRELRVIIPPDKRNTGPAAIKMPPEIGEVMPFRYLEVENAPKGSILSVKQIAVHYPFNDDASYFECDDTVLNDVWDLCKYSIKATSFCGVYIDGDRERIPYEADAYINQLCHYAVDREFSMARRTHEYLIMNPTWPYEWIMHSVMIAWADYMATGNSRSMRYYYDDLKAKTLSALEREDGLIAADPEKVTDEVKNAIHYRGSGLRPIVDWPHGNILGLKGGYGETDDFEFMPVNTVVNAFHYRSLVLISRIANALGKRGDSRDFGEAAERVRTAINTKLFDHKRGIYLDGEGSSHSSLHANMFPLAFGVVPEDRIRTVAEFIKSRGLVCSVYGAQHLLEALYAAGESEYAMSLMTSRSERSWAHMIYDVGTTITLEAWDDKFKPNQDWNHAWGAAPANIIPRYVMGIRPITAGYGQVLIEPQPAHLKWARAAVPTIRGSIEMEFEHWESGAMNIRLNIPANCLAKVALPLPDGRPHLSVDGKRIAPKIVRERIVIDRLGSGKHHLSTGVNNDTSS